MFFVLKKTPTNNILLLFCRQVLSYVGNSTMRKTNPKCTIKTSVKHDGTPPSVLVNFGKIFQDLVLIPCLHLICAQVSRPKLY